jgi:hypothetical protein
MHNNPKYLFLCRYHQLVVTGQERILEEYNRSNYAQITKICPQCKKEFKVPRYLAMRTMRNFCSHSCRGKFYYKQSYLKKKNENKNKASVEP